LGPVRLLLVDDDETVLAGLSLILEANEFEVTTAGNVVEALRLIAAERFDVLLTDLHMPGPGDGLILVGAIRHANPKAVTLVLSSNPDMGRASAALLHEADEVFVKPAKAGPIVEAIQQRLNNPERGPRTLNVVSIASILERQRAEIISMWQRKMRETNNPAEAEGRALHRLEEALDEVLYRLRNPQGIGAMTLFSMAAMQHGANRRRQGRQSIVLVEEVRALQVALFETIHANLQQIDLGELPGALMAIADEMNAQLVQSVAGYEKEKPVGFGGTDR
jgi:DNA-binding response OmpR family regulator